jgi:hypothetical protein
MRQLPMERDGNNFPRLPTAVSALWQGLPTLPPGRPKSPSLTCGLKLRSGDGRVWRLSGDPRPAQAALWLSHVTSRLNGWLRLIRRPDVTSCHLITSTEDHRFCYSVPISQAPRRKSMLLWGIHSHVKLYRLLRRPGVTLCGAFGYIPMLSCDDYSGAQT